MIDVIGNEVNVGNWVTYITGGGKCSARLRCGRVTIADESSIQIQPYRRISGHWMPDESSIKHRKYETDVTLIRDLG